MGKKTARDLFAAYNHYVSEAAGPIPSLTKGSIISSDIGGVPVALTSGTHGYALVADSGTTSGLGWAAFAGSNFYLDGLSFGTDSKITGSMTGVGDVVSNAMTTFTPATTFTAEASFTTGLVVGGNATAAGYIKINPDTDDTGDFPTTLKVGVNTEAQTYTLPLAYPTSSGYALVSTDAGVMSWAVNQDGNYYVTGGTYSAGAIAFSGTTSFPTFSVTGIPTGTTTASNTQTFTNKTWNGAAIADGYISSATNWNSAYDNYVASAAYSAGTLTFTQRDGGTFTATGFEVGDVTGGGADNYVAHWTSATNVTGTSDFTFDGTDLSVSVNEDAIGYIGRAVIGYNFSDYASFSHYDMRANTGGYALLAKNDGTTYLNAATGKEIDFRINNSTKMRLDSDGEVGIGTTAPAYKLDVVGTTQLSGAATLTSTATVGSTLTVTGATTAKSTLTATGATTMLGGGTASGNLYVKTGSRNQMHMDPTLTSAKMVIRDSGGTADISEFMYYPRISIEQDATDPTGPAANAGYPSIYFLKYGPSGVSSPVGGDPVGWRQVASGAAGASSAPQYMVWEYSTDMDGANFSDKLKLKNDGTLTTTTFAGALLGTIDSTTTAVTQASSDNSTKVATTAYADAAAAGGGTSSPLTTKGDIWVYSTTNARLPVGTNDYILTADSSETTGLKWVAAATGTIGGSIAEDRIAVGTSTANTITGTSRFEWNEATLTMTNTGNTAITLLGDANRSSADSHAMAMRGKWDGTVIGTVMIATGPDDTNKDDGQILFYTASAGTQTERMRIDETGNVGIGTTAPEKLLDVRGGGTTWALAALSGSNSHGTGLQLYNSNTTVQDWAIIGGGASHNYSFRVYDQTDATYRFAIDRDGKVGIGGTNSEIVNPGALLHINSDTTGDIEVLRLENSNASTTSIDSVTQSFRLRRDQDDYSYHAAKLTAVKEQGWTNSSATVDASLTFSTIQNETTSEKMRITSAGNVGIGTTAPSYPLHVVQASGDTYGMYLFNSASRGIYFGDTSNDGTGYGKIGGVGGSLFLGSSQVYTSFIGTGDASATLGSQNRRWSYFFTRYGQVGYDTSTSSTAQFGISGAADKVPLEVYANGATTPALHVTSGSNVGIGTTSPLAAAKLTLSDATNTYLNFKPQATHNNWTIGADAAGFVFYDETVGGYRMSISDAGNVGIGTTAPDRKLDVNAGSATAFVASGTGGGTYGVARIVDNADSVPLELVGQRADDEGPVLRIKHESASPAAGDYVGTVAFTGYTSTDALGNYSAIRGRAIDVTNGSTDGALLFQNFIANSRTTGMILSGAKLGIGSDNTGGFAPSEYLEVRSSADDDPAIKLYNARSPSASGSLTFQHRGSSVKIKSSGSAVAPFIWELQGSEEMRLNDTGLGIGTTAPVQKLHVDGYINLHGSDDQIRWGNSSNSSIRYNSSDGMWMSGYKWHFKAYDGSSGYTEYMTLATGGNVGIGTTTPEQKLDVRGYAIQLKSDSNTNVAYIGDADRSGADSSITAFQGFWDGTKVADMLIITGDDTVNKDNGHFIFRTATEGSVSERMRITDAGYVGIGTTAPTRTLDVRGRSFVSGAADVVPFEVYAYGAGTSAMHVTSGSDTGLGTATPLAKLHINGGAYQMVFQRDSYNHTIVKGNSDDRLIFATGAPGSHTTRFSILSTGVDVVNDLTVTGTATLGGIAMGGNTVDDILLAADAVSTGDDELTTAGYVAARYAPVAITGTIAGSIATDQIAFGASANTIEGTGDLTWTHSTGLLNLNSRLKITAGGAASVPVYFQPSQDAKEIQFRAYSSNADIMRLTDGADVAIGHTAALNGGKLTVLDATRPLVLAYDTSNYTSFDISANGGLTLTVPHTFVVDSSRHMDLDIGSVTREHRFMYGGTKYGYATTTDSNTFWTIASTSTPTAGMMLSGAAGSITLKPHDKDVDIYGAVQLVNGQVTSNPGTNHLWASGATLFWGTSQIGTTTPGAGSIEGTATAGQVSYGDGSNSITSTSNFTFTNNDNMTITSATTLKPQLILQNTTDDATSPELVFKNTRGGGNGSNGDDAGIITTYAQDSTGSPYLATQIVMEGDSASSKHGEIRFYSRDADTSQLTQKLEAGNNYIYHGDGLSATVFGHSNEINFYDSAGASGPIHWQYRGGTFNVARNAIHVRAYDHGTYPGYVGIGTSSPTVKLDVVGAIKNSSYIHQDADSSSTGVIVGAGGDANFSYDGTNAHLSSRRVGTGDLLLNSGGGDVGIGVNSTTEALTVYSGDTGNQLGLYSDANEVSALNFYENTTKSAELLFDPAANDVKLINRISGGDMIFRVENNTEAMRILNDGNVGIGTTAPGTPLQINNTGTVKTTNNILTIEETVGSGAADNEDTASAILFKGYNYDATTPTSVGLGRILTSHVNDMTTTASTQDGIMEFQTAINGTLTGQMSIGYDGNGQSLNLFGIGVSGTGTPQINYPDVANTYLYFGSDGSYVSGSTYKPAGISTDGNPDPNSSGGDQQMAIFAQDDLSLAAGHYGKNGSNRIVFRTTESAASNPTERMTVLGGGNVGIGTSSPGGKVDIVGSSGTVTQTPDGDAEELVIRNNHRAGISILSSDSASRGGYIVFGGATDANAANIHHDFNGKTFSFQGQNSDMELRFASANNVEAMRIDTSQNVGIGETTPSYKLDLGDKFFWDSNYFRTNQTRGAAIMNEAPSSTNPVFSFYGDEDTGMSRADNNKLSLITAGVEALRIDADQKIVLGTTTTVNGAKLHVHAGDTNLVANFDSTDGIAEIRLRDNVGTGSDKYTRLLSVGSQYKIMPNDGVELMVLDGSANTVTVAGVLSATAKSFNIAHPLYKDKRLVHGSLEGPEHGIYIRGTIEAKEYGCEIELPEYWDAMCEDYTVQLTPHGPYTVYINEKQKDKVMVASTSREYKFDYYIVGARTDETLEVVQDG